MNPQFPKAPVRFPGEYGSAWAKFEQRPDGGLDFTLRGTTFIPLGPGLRFPLPFVGAGLPASVPAAGTALHPQICLSTKRPAATTNGAAVPGFPFNTVQELTVFSHNTNFGDTTRTDKMPLTCRFPAQCRGVRAFEATSKQRVARSSRARGAKKFWSAAVRVGTFPRL